MFESAVGDAIISSATTFLYIGGLVAFVAWLKRRDLLRSGPSMERS